MSIEQKRALEGLFFWSKVKHGVSSKEVAGQFELLARQCSDSSMADINLFYS